MSNISLTLTSQFSNPLELALGNALTAHSFEINQINPISVTLAPTLPGSKGETGEQGEQGIQGLKGEDGREIELRVDNGQVQWKYVDASIWTNLVSVASLSGAKGDDGLSAYDVAVAQGFSGTAPQWLQSLVGEKGDKGDTGATGVTGSAGATGATGSSAYQVAVSQGFSGNVNQWLISLIGAKGDKGDTGSQGIKGDTGLQGIQGIKGDTGSQGALGIQGIPGIKGDKGDTGETGAQGIQGIQGLKGDQGIQGIQGIQGLKGDTGDVGATGAKGDPGAGIATGGTVGQLLRKVDSTDYNTQWSTITQDSIGDGTTYKQYSATEKTKLAGIATGAEVNVNADWNSSSGDSQILNKPTLGTAAAKDIPSSGNATSTQVVLGNDTRLSDSRTPSAHTHAEAEITNLSTDLAAKVTGNTAITGATKTKITYDSKGLVTGGADATTADVADSTNKRYVSDAQLSVIGNTSGTNTGDQTLPTDATLVFTDVTTNNASTSKHGFLPKLPTPTGKYLKDDLTWGSPEGGSGSSVTLATVAAMAIALG